MKEDEATQSVQETTSTDTVKHEPPGFFSFENIRSLAVLIIAILALRWSIASPYHVPTASMEPTIKVGDRLLAYKLAYNIKVPFTDWVMAEWATPKRGDIIVFKYPKNPEIDYVKRVVGLAGDEIQITDDILYINGKPQPRTDHNSDRAILEDIEDHKEIKLLYEEELEGVKHWTMQSIPSQRRFTRSSWPPQGTYKVPENSLFVMGDNRDNSTDSRIWGEVPLSYVRGKATFVIWSAFSPESAEDGSGGFSFPTVRFRRFGKWLQ